MILILPCPDDERYKAIAGHHSEGLFDENGWLVAGHTSEECDEIYGDELVKYVSWKNDTDLGSLRGRPVSLRFEIKEADIYSIQII